jgi:hypothetical protein
MKGDNELKEVFFSFEGCEYRLCFEFGLFWLYVILPDGSFELIDSPSALSNGMNLLK